METAKSRIVNLLEGSQCSTSGLVYLASGIQMKEVRAGESCRT